jgi:Tfp pilus assembly protein PilF
VLESLTALFQLYIRPVAAIGRILDRGRLWFAIAAALLVAVLVHTADPSAVWKAAEARQRMAHTLAEGGDPAQLEPPAPFHIVTDAAGRFASYDPGSFFGVLFAIAVALVPGMIALRAIAGHGSFSVLMRRDYLSLLMCALLCWSAAFLLVAIATGSVYLASSGESSIQIAPVFAAATIYFLILTALAVRTSWGTTFLNALGLTLAGTAAAVVFTGLLPFVPIYYLASPFLLFYAWRFMDSEVSSLGDGLRSRQHLRQQLELATTNPRDADAHYQLGLIYQERRQYTEAIARFLKAIEIDPSESGAQFQLGRIARQQSRFDDAIRFLTAAAKLDDKLASSEVWRELGAAYAGASRFEEAAPALAKYTARRPYDPEGQYWFGKTLAALSRANEAQEAFRAAIEAVDTMPKHRRAEVRQWKSLAARELRP